jgi:isoquinoline 1-oxidoreductase beta subunit
LVAWTFVPRTFPIPLEPAAGEHLFGAWLKIAEDSVVSVAVPQLEMGQGISTLIPQIVAEELGADWRQVAIEPAPVSPAYPNVPLARRWAMLWDPLVAGLSEGSDAWLAARFAREQRFTATADGTSLAAYEAMARSAGAAARAMLAMEAAARWGTTWEECEVDRGLVIWRDRSATFGELASGAAERSPPDPPPLRPAAPVAAPLPNLPHGLIPGDIETPSDYPRIDCPAKVDGSLAFAADVRLPGMVYAAIRHGPNNGAELTGFNEAGAAGIPGVIGAVRNRRWLAVAATTWWTAEQALTAMRPRFRAAYPVDSAEIEARLDTQLDGGASFEIARVGESEAAGQDMRVDFARRYDAAPAHAAPLETASATARYTGDRLDLWMASQAPEQAREAAARAVGLASHQVALYPMPAGGSFDARLEHDHAIEIAHIAKTLERPVQLTWSRRSEMIRSRPRPPYAMLLGAQLTRAGGGAGGMIETLRMRIACPSAGHEFGRRLFGNLTAWAAIRETIGKPDPLALEGALPAYQIPRMSAHHIPTEIRLPTGRVRGNSHGPMAFATESFVDEIAARASREPLSFRMAMLGSDPRLAACLQRAASMAQWDGGSDQSGQGLACYRLGDEQGGARIACVATARRDAESGSGGVRLSRMAVAVDIGRIVNLDIARQQIEGGLVFGIGTALGRALAIRGGVPSSTDYADMGLPTLADTPEIAVDFLPSDAVPADPGELGAIIAPPAIANALFSATGLRLRRLPLLSGGI